MPPRGYGRKKYKYPGKRSKSAGKFSRKGKKYTKRTRSGFKSKGRSKLSIAKQMAAILPDQVYLDNYPDAVTVNGTNNTKATQIIWGSKQTSSDTDSVQISPINLMPSDLSILQQIMYQQLSTVSFVAPPGPSAGISAGSCPTAQLLIKSWSVEAVITNLETGPIEFTHYRCKARRDFSGPGSNISLAGVITGGPTDTAIVGGGAVPTGITNQVLSTTYGATPFMNPRFTATIHILKTKKYILAPGKSIRLKYIDKNARLWKNEDFNMGNVPDGDGSTSPNRTILKGQRFSVFQMAGTFATNSTNNAGYRTGVGNAAVGILYQHKVHYAAITPQVMQTSANNAVTGFGFGNAYYPLPIVANVPYSAISTGPVPAAAGTVTFAAKPVVQDNEQIF